MMIILQAHFQSLTVTCKGRILYAVSCLEHKRDAGKWKHITLPSASCGRSESCERKASSMSSIQVTIKPTSGGEKFQAEIETSATVRELKEEVARKCDTSADQQRLIYKGQVLKDDRIVESYGKV